MTKNKKYLIIGIIAFFIVMGLVASFIYFNNRNIQKEINIKWNDLVLNVYEEKYLSDLISESNVDLSDVVLDTSKLGKNEITFDYKYRNHKFTDKVTYEVIDTEKPHIFGGVTKTVEVNYDKNLCDLVIMIDNYDRNLTCEIEGDYNLNKVGVYKIKLNVSDASGNKNNHNITLNVVSKINNTPSKSTNLLFDEAKANYLKDGYEIGIDVSKWQQDIDFNKVKNAGATFVMMRIGIRSSIGGEINMDSYFLSNIKKAKEVGLKVGVYLYSKASSEAEAIEEAKWVINALNGEKLDLPIAFDWENWSSFNSFYLNFHDLNNLAKSFIKTVKENGYEGMLYSSKSYLENFWFDEEFKPIWLAHYTKETSYANYTMWQFSNVGLIDGINGDVDLDILKIS